jgi:NAD(P)H-dependent FMN reductase
MSSSQTGPLVVAVAGSQRDDSVTRQALVRTLDSARERGARTELLDLREYDLPMLDPDVETPTDAVRLTDRIAAADVVVLGTPMYHGSYSSPLKTALDYCGFDEFENTTVGLVSVAGGSFPTRPLDHLRGVCRALNAWVLPHQVAVPDTHSIGDAFPTDIADRLDELGEQAVAYATITPAERDHPVAPADD